MLLPLQTTLVCNMLSIFYDVKMQLLTIIFFLCFWLHSMARGSQFPGQQSNPYPLQGKRRVVTTGPQGNSFTIVLKSQD